MNGGLKTLDGDLHKTHKTETQGVSRWIPETPHFHQQGIVSTLSQLIIESFRKQKLDRIGQ